MPASSSPTDPTAEAAMVIGLDGCTAGWVAVGLHADGSFAAAWVYRTLDPWPEEWGDPAAVAVDMPLHLLAAAKRPADLEARAALGPRSRSIFPAPPAFVLDPQWSDASHAEINRECRRRYGAGLSAQSHSLIGKIREVNALARSHPSNRIVEAHPELTFRAMNADTPLAHSKKSWRGFHQRRDLLSQHGIDLPNRFSGPADCVAGDDLLDAAAMAWTAHRLARGLAKSFPQHLPSANTTAIWY